LFSARISLRDECHHTDVFPHRAHHPLHRGVMSTHTLHSGALDTNAGEKERDSLPPGAYSCSIGNARCTHLLATDTRSWLVDAQMGCNFCRNPAYLFDSIIVSVSLTLELILFTATDSAEVRHADCIVSVTAGNMHTGMNMRAHCVQGEIMGR
jgi:hypothetical protein